MQPSRMITNRGMTNSIPQNKLDANNLSLNVSKDLITLPNEDNHQGLSSYPWFITVIL